MAWHLLEKVIEHSAAHSTIFGKWWIAIMFVFRIIVVASIGDTVYSDEQDEFVCNTKQPGCKQVCYNMFAPISHIRFWALQIIATGTPPMIFIIFAMHRLARIPSKPSGDEATKEVGTQTSWRYASRPRSRDNRSDKDKKHNEKRSDSKNSSSSRLRRENELLYDVFDRDESTSTAPPKYEKVCRERKLKRTKLVVLRAYVFNVIVRTLIEGGCLFVQYILYQWIVPEFYECIGYPCPKIVECYISRPMEKTIFLHFMFAVGVTCLAINIIELKYLGWLRLKRLFARPKPEYQPPSAVLGTYPVDDVSRVHDRHSGEPKRLGRIIHRDAEIAPPGYYIPDVDPPSEKYRSPANGFPHIRMRAASFTTSESDVTTDDATSVGSMTHMMETNARNYL